MLKPKLSTALVMFGLTAGVVLAGGQDNSVAETIAARRGLMNQLGTLQALIDARLGDAGALSELHDLSHAAAASLAAFAVLMPPETNLLGAATVVEGAETTAAATIWDDLPAFQQLLRDAADQARAASEAADLAGFTAAWDKVAEACVSCHQSHIAYDPFAAFN